MKRTILLAEDSVTDSEILKHIFEENYDSYEASNGQEALRIFKEFSSVLSAIIVDIHMPGMNGFSLIKSITADPHWRQIPIIVA